MALIGNRSVVWDVSRIGVLPAINEYGDEIEWFLIADDIYAVDPTNDTILNPGAERVRGKERSAEL